MLFQEGILYSRKFRLLERNRTPRTGQDVGCPCGLAAINGKCPPVLYMKAKHKPPHRTRSNTDCCTPRHARAMVTVQMGRSVAAGYTHSAHRTGCGCYRTSIPVTSAVALCPAPISQHTTFCTRTRKNEVTRARATCRC